MTSPLTLSFQHSCQTHLWVSRTLLGQVPSFLKKFFPLQTRYFLIADKKPFQKTSPSWPQAFSKLNLPFIKTTILYFDERHKTLEQAQKLYHALQKQGATRYDVLLLLGGGVVTDLGGFVGATYLRGLRYVSLPTTLLAQVDSCIGGKVGVDFNGVKNAVGVFHHPSLVFCDIDFLQGLSDRDYTSGLAEVIKYGFIAQPLIIHTLLEQADRIKKRDPALLSELIYQCLDVKARLVQEDERDFNVRHILNFGHTLGHALESLGGLKTYTHGEAIALGMLLETYFAVRQGECSPGILDKLFEVLNLYDLPTRLPKPIPLEKFQSLLSLDKKNQDSKTLTLILPVSLGKVRLARRIPLQTILERLNDFYTLRQ